MARIFSSLDDPELAQMIRDGAVGILPTDTVYGLVCSARSQPSVERLYDLKHREHMPGTLIGANIDQIAALGIPRRYLKAVEQYWPGSVSVETPHDVSYLSQGTGRQAIRIPPYEDLLTLMETVGPLQTTSANASGEPTAKNVAEARSYFGETVDFYVDVGDMGERPASTIIRVVDGVIEVVRAGAVTFDEHGRIVT